ncbi:hypothetical protein [Pseudogemmobacter bohemicus]|uniref:hypothetical protein n=1 Tax=Pseudogemmobacter bohemicus TaxID=2250708 RepID=UPI000DD32545|nr:hypothetical protein [Pseudogemmobacter bohemicus]
MVPFHLFLRLETGTGREDWLLISAAAAALTTFLGLWLSAGGADHVTQSLRGVISDAVNEIGSEGAAATALPPEQGEMP